MKITTKFMLALAMVGSLVLTSCKDYDEDNYNNALISSRLITDDLQKQIDDLTAALKKVKECNCPADMQDLKDQVTEQTQQQINTALEALKTGDMKTMGDQIINLNNQAALVNGMLGNDSTFICQYYGATSLKDALDKLGKGEILSYQKFKQLVDTKADSARIYKALSDSCKSMLDSISSVAKQVLINKDSIALLDGKTEAIEKAYKQADALLNKRIDSLVNVCDSLGLLIDDLGLRVDSLEDARAKQVTGIIAQQIYNPAFGAYNSLVTNAQSNMLIAYWGVNNNYTEFPSIEDANETIEVFPGKLVNEGANAGKLYVTINPNTVDFTGLKNCLKLVNSQDEECAMKIGELKKSDKVLTLGLTRAAGNGFYEAGVNLAESDVENPKLKMTIDAKSLAKVAKNVASNRDKASILEMANEAAKALLEANSLEAQGIKCSWKDMYGEHAVYSNYNIAALAVKPLGFNTVDAIFAENGKYWSVVNKTKEMITKTTQKVAKKAVNEINKQFMIDKLNGDIEDVLLKLDHIDPVEADPNAMKFIFTIDTTLTVKFKVDASVDLEKALEEKTISTKYYYEGGEVKVDHSGDVTVKTLKDNGEAIVVKATVTKPADGETGPNISAYDIKFNFARTIDFSGKFKDIVDQINAGFDDTNDLIDAMEVMLKDANTMLNNIKKLEAKLESGEFITNRLFKYLDKAANMAGKATPRLFKPTLVVNSDAGFGFAGFTGHASAAKGNVTLIPTTYSNEVLAPIYKKYIRVKNMTGITTFEKIYDGSDDAGKEIPVTLTPGMNTITYGALDFTGKEITEDYKVLYNK